MSTRRLNHSRWMEWRPSGQIIGDSAEDEPTKPSKPGSEGFVGAASVGLPNIQLKSPSAEKVVHGHERAIPWAEWKAAALNQLFREQGVTGRPGQITGATVQHADTRRKTTSAKVVATGNAHLGRTQPSSDRIALCPPSGPTERSWANATWTYTGCGMPAHQTVHTAARVSAVDSAGTDEQSMSRAEATK